MQVFCRKAGGKDPLGDVVFINVVSDENTEESALLRSWSTVDKWNKDLIKRDKELTIAILHCGDTLLEVKTGKLRSLTGKIKGNLERQPSLDMPSKTEPRLL